MTNDPGATIFLPAVLRDADEAPVWVSPAEIESITPYAGIVQSSVITFKSGRGLIVLGTVNVVIATLADSAKQAVRAMLAFAGELNE